MPPRMGAVYDGRKGATTVTVPRVERSIVVDGSLDEPAWRDAATLTGFSQFFPVDRLPAPDSTEVLVWYSSTDLHVGIRAYAAAGTVRATLADRDRIAQDDNIQLFLGTYADSRQAFVFGVNPLGIQSDGVLNETGAQSGGGFTSTTARSREAPDLAPDYLWRSKGRVTPWGYEVELTIPFKSLRYRAGDEQSWQLNVIRTVQATGFEYSWTAASRASASFLAQSGRLVGLRDLRRGLTLDLIPTVTSSAVGLPLAAGGWDYARRDPEIGGSARWGITSNLTLSATGNPDFSQVEADATQFSLDPRSAIYFTERRPFFLESQEQFATPNQLIYTRRIVQPVAAAKLTGKSGGFDIGFLSAVDSKSVSLDSNSAPTYNVLRVQRDVGRQSRVGVVYTDRIERDAWNRVGGIDGRYVRGILSVNAQAAGSLTGNRGAPTSRAPLWNLSATLTGRHWYARYAAGGIDERFNAGSGFITRPGIATLQATHRYTHLGERGALIESFSPEIYTLARYQYDAFVGGHGPQDRQLHLRTNTRFRGGWQFGAQLLLEEFGYDPALFANYRLLRPTTAGGVDTIGYTGTRTLPNLDYVVSLATPEFKRFSLNTVVIIGRDENFPEWASAGINVWSGGVTVRPTERLRLNGTWNREDFSRVSDDSRVQLRNVRRLRAEYQVTRQVFVRVIGEHTLFTQAALRDDGRTGLPVYFASANGRLSPSVAVDQRRLRFDYLFSYLPSPGTVVYFGYGDARRADRPSGFERLTRTRDEFFLKLSYLYRVQ